ncbi:MAG: metallophosphoesterase [Leptospirales bacterium]
MNHATDSSRLQKRHFPDRQSPQTREGVLKIQYASDIHIEVNPGKPLRRSHLVGDVLVLAGDIAGSPQQMAHYCRSLGDRPILYVLGNHEFYGHDWDRAVGLYRNTLERECPNVRILDNEAAVVDGIRFLGTTLWTDFLFGAQGPASEAEIPDFDHIRRSGERIHWPEMRNRFNESFRWIRDQMEPPVNLPTVVVTHHAPSWLSNSPQFAGSPITGAFCNKLDEFIREHPVALWIHGHLHNSSAYMIGETLVVCNPHGFYDENQEWNPVATIDV